MKYLEQHGPGDASLGLAITPGVPVYQFFGSNLGHHVGFSPCKADWNTVFAADGWRVLHRRVASSCA